MKIAILGTGRVGRTLGSRLAALGHEVMLAGRSAGSGAEWADESGQRSGSYGNAAGFCDLAILAVKGEVAIEVVRPLHSALADKILIDVTNPLDFSRGMPPVLIEGLNNTTSLGEAIQEVLPDTRVVKALNTMNCEVMVDPSRVEGRHDVFVCGEDAAAKAQVVALLGTFGWEAPIDLGGIAAARATEGFLPLWLRLWGALGHGEFNIGVAGRRP